MYCRIKNKTAFHLFFLRVANPGRYRIDEPMSFELWVPHMPTYVYRMVTVYGVLYQDSVERWMPIGWMDVQQVDQSKRTRRTIIVR